MKVYLNKISGIDDAIVTMFMSKRTWTRELEEEVRDVVSKVTDRDGKINSNLKYVFPEHYAKFEDWVEKLVKWGAVHITMLRYIDFSITVEGLHRAGQDDWDAHAMRYNNRIIRTSTRLSKFGNEMSDYYKGKIIPTDEALKILNIEVPDKFVYDETIYTKTINGYVREDLKDNKDVLRGLYMLSIPSNFTFKVNLTEFAHVYKERNKDGRANPEVKECCEAIADQIQEWCPYFTRELLMSIKN